MHTLSLVLLQASAAVAYPWVSGQPGVNSGLFRNARTVERRQANCPFNPVHKGAAPYTAPYTYTGAKNGVPGSQKGGIKVPADGDTAHAYTPPGPNDIRGPCPGLNAAANHNFLSHDGITNFQELVDAQQNVYNVGYDLAVLLAVLGIEAGGDVLSGRLSIGCDATSRTATLPILGTQPGLDGHNKFEADSSLTRNDFFLADGDNYSFNGTLFAARDGTRSSRSVSGTRQWACMDTRALSVQKWFSLPGRTPTLNLSCTRFPSGLSQKLSLTHAPESSSIYPLQSTKNISLLFPLLFPPLCPHTCY